MTRRVIAGFIVVGLVIGVWLVWPRNDGTDPTPTTELAAASTTEPEAQSTAPPTIAPDPTTTTTVIDSHVVETVEEAEAILRELWFGWFEGIYNQDEDRIREVVATEESVEAAKSQFTIMEFLSPPSPDQITLSETEVLRSDMDCLAVWSAVQAGFRVGGSEGLHVLRWSENRWVLLSLWTSKEELWEDDCEARLAASSPDS